VSYELRIFHSVPGEDPLETAFRFGWPDYRDKPIEPVKEDRKKRIASALIDRDPKLQVFPTNVAAISDHLKITEDEVRRRFRDIILSGPAEDRTGIEITLHDDGITVAISFWHKGNRAREVFQLVQGYVEVISREFESVIFDPQIERIITRDEILSETLQEYSAEVSRLHAPAYVAEISKLIQKTRRQD
jgi:hypothetical protein